MDARENWTFETWNPLTGCTKVSQGCKNCYALPIALRLQANGVARYTNGFRLTLHEDLLDLPFTWRKPRLVFVNSMSDLFHRDVPLSFLKRLFETMRQCPQHTFMALTKRSERLRELAGELPWPENVWMGVSVEDERVIGRVHDLQEVPAAVRFLSCEPLIGPLDTLPLQGIHWVIVGGESGPGARPIQKAWIHSIREQCEEARVAFYFKQWGGIRRDQAGRELDGITYTEMPSRPIVPAPTAQQLPLFTL